MADYEVTFSRTTYEAATVLATASSPEDALTKACDNIKTDPSVLIWNQLKDREPEISAVVNEINIPAMPPEAIADLAALMEKYKVRGIQIAQHLELEHLADKE